MKKRIKAPFYTETKLGIGNMFKDTKLPNGWLYSKGRNATKITAADLPEHYIPMTVFKVLGYISVFGIVDIKYRPNYRINHMHRDDFLYISYSTPIKGETDQYGHVRYYDYDALLYGGSIVLFIRAVRRFQSYDIEPIAAEVDKKERYFIEKHPEECAWMSLSCLLEPELQEEFAKKRATKRSLERSGCQTAGDE